MIPNDLLTKLPQDKLLKFALENLDLIENWQILKEIHNPDLIPIVDNFLINKYFLNETDIKNNIKPTGICKFTQKPIKNVTLNQNFITEIIRLNALNAIIITEWISNQPLFKNAIQNTNYKTLHLYLNPYKYLDDQPKFNLPKDLKQWLYKFALDKFRKINYKDGINDMINLIKEEQMEVIAL